MGGGVDDDGVVVAESSGGESVGVRIEYDRAVAAGDEVETVGDVGGDVFDGAAVGGVEVFAETDRFSVVGGEDGGEVAGGVDEEGAVSGLGVVDGE